jgi:hypothetical protein
VAIIYSGKHERNLIENFGPSRKGGDEFDCIVWIVLYCETKLIPLFLFTYTSKYFIYHNDTRMLTVAFNKKEYNREYWLKNKEKLKEHKRKYYLKNKEKEKERVRKYWLKNKEKLKEHKRKYQWKWKQKNKEKLKEHKRKYYLKNKEKCVERAKGWQLKNPERYAFLDIRGQVKRSCKPNTSKEDINQIAMLIMLRREKKRVI